MGMLVGLDGAVDVALASLAAALAAAIAMRCVRAI